MRLLSAFSCMLLFGSVAASQSLKGCELVPSSEILPVIVVQNDSPLKVINYVVARNEAGRIVTFYTVRNTGLRNIKSYRIARWFSDNTGFIGNGIMPTNTRFLVPDREASSIPSSPLEFANPRIKDSTAKMKAVAYILIYDVQFDDGSEYSEQKTFDLFSNLLERFPTSP